MSSLDMFYVCVYFIKYKRNICVCVIYVEVTSNNTGNKTQRYKGNEESVDGRRRDIGRARRGTGCKEERRRNRDEAVILGKPT